MNIIVSFYEAHKEASKEGSGSTLIKRQNITNVQNI